MWRLRDKKFISAHFPELITALQFKPRQTEGEAPVMVVGLVEGGVRVVEVVRASGSMLPELHTTVVERSAVKGQSSASKCTLFCYC